MRNAFRPTGIGTVLTAAALLGSLASCASTGRTSRRSASPLVNPHTDAAVALFSSDLQRANQADGPLTDVLRRSVPGLHVDRSNLAGSCPRLRFRGTESLIIDSQPAIYVDGVRQADACVLESISGLDVDAVFVYPGTRGFRMNAGPSGVILVYTRTD